MPRISNAAEGAVNKDADPIAETLRFLHRVRSEQHRPALQNKVFSNRFNAAMKFSLHYGANTWENADYMMHLQSSS